ncbi:hypothetical protein [Mycobacterium intermedium]|nr:hypothetical protein [Mycobacterium intermedium]
MQLSPRHSASPAEADHPGDDPPSIWAAAGGGGGVGAAPNWDV